MTEREFWQGVADDVTDAEAHLFNAGVLAPFAEWYDACGGDLDFVEFANAGLGPAALADLWRMVGRIEGAGEARGQTVLELLDELAHPKEVA